MLRHEQEPAANVHAGQIHDTTLTDGSLLSSLRRVVTTSRCETKLQSLIKTTVTLTDKTYTSNGHQHSCQKNTKDSRISFLTHLKETLN